MDHRRLGFVVSTAAFALVAACGSGTSGGSSSTACSDYYSALIAAETKCLESPLPPASEISREEVRVEQVCQNELALPGNSVTGSNLEACVSAVASATCRQNQTPSACQLPPGTKPAGAACNESTQCQSYSCSMGASGTSSTGCGTCAAAIADGDPCGGTILGQCGQNSACDISLTSGTGTCKAFTYGNAGDTCDGFAAQCSQGLYCDTTKKQCAATLGAGATCTGTEACTWPLICTGTMSLKCESPASAGEACSGDSDCASGLGCSNAVPPSTTGACGAVTWVSGGQTCGSLVRCLVGTCPFDTMTGKTAGTCPKVLNDGQACDPTDTTETCDVGASCIGGKCVLEDSVVCK
jgi:hypothetical protein